MFQVSVLDAFCGGIFGRTHDAIITNASRLTVAAHALYTL